MNRLTNDCWLDSRDSSVRHTLCVALYPSSTLWYEIILGDPRQYVSAAGAPTESGRLIDTTSDGRV